ncbi:Neurotrimin [Apis cerana cerana]|uniref:Neurotrimin n=1 Tax=Apis cerana cerana TaxID=94128 RepID=A0A2A3E8R9_APICC|nr:Neurotrimin [Apis cerana cerana]
MEKWIDIHRISYYTGRFRRQHPCVSEGPSFTVPITNVTIPMGREAVLTCVVANLSIYKVAWLRVDTQTILTIANHVITKNHRIGVTHTERKTWHLHIRDVTESDRGAYMCQINTDPMKSQTGYLDVVVPPDILDYMTSTDMIVREGSNVTLRCAAKGSPTPNITWRREGGESIFFENGEEVRIVEGSIFNIIKINRLQMGAYLCIASNGIPPTVSKRIMLTVQFSPMISIQNQLVGAQEGQRMTLECNSEAFPQSINYWTKENNEIIKNGDKYNQSFTNNVYKVHMKLTILATEMSDYGTYKCISKNSLGETDGSIKLYHIPTPTTQPRTTTTTTPVPTTSEEVENIQNSRQRPEASADPSTYQITDSSLPNVEHRTDDYNYLSNIKESYQDLIYKESLFLDIHLHGRASSDSYNDAETVITTNERKSIDSEIRRIDNTAQSMSSRDSNSNFQMTISCIIV